ncbi:acyl carrier protein [Kitasatospora sp. NPDC054939]
MTISVPPQQDVTAESVRAWLLERVALYVERPVSEIAPDVKLVEYGLDSVYALTLCGDIDDEYGIEVDPTLAWDYPTVDAIVGFLTEELGK